MKKQDNFLPVKERDARDLSNSIVEVEASRELYENAAKMIDYNPSAIKDVLDYFIQALKKHKALWKEMLFKYVGEENAAFYRDLYKFDIYKKVIFLPEDMEVQDETDKN